MYTDGYEDYGHDWESSEHQDDVMIAVVGSTGTGTFSFIRPLTGDTSVDIDNNLESETSDIHSLPFLHRGSGRKVTPGFVDGVTNTDILKKIAEVLLEEYDNKRKLNGLMYLQRISDPRFGGHPGRNLMIFRNLCGTGMYKNIGVLTTFWDRVVIKQAGVKREQQLKLVYFRHFVEERTRFTRYDRSQKSAYRVLTYIFTLQPTNIQIQGEIRVDGKKLEDTVPGSVHQEGMERIIAKHKEDIADITDELFAIKRENEAVRQELQQERAKLQGALARRESEKSALQKSLEDETHFRKVLEAKAAEERENYHQWRDELEQRWRLQLQTQAKVHEKCMEELQADIGHMRTVCKQIDGRKRGEVVEGATVIGWDAPPPYTPRITQLLIFPIVLIHGFTDTPSLSGSWKIVERLLRELGIEFFTPQIPPIGSIEERSNSLIRQISAKYPGANLHLFGHSMGGLNARDVAFKALNSNLGFTVKTVTTFGTPHWGVKAIDFVPEVDGASTGARVIRSIFGTDFAGLGNLTHSFMVKYNASTPDNPNVKYFSWAGEITIPTVFFIGSFPPSRIFGPTDGLVNTDSARWGTYLGTIQGLDHFAIAGRMSVSATIPHLAAAESGQTAVVQRINNNVVQAIANSIDGTINSFLAPQRAMLDRFGLPF